METVIRALPVDLTDADVAEYSEMLARATTEQTEIEAEKKSAMSHFTDRMNRVVAESRLLARKITTRKELRDIPCDFRFDFTNEEALLVRRDTGEIVERRPMTAEEKQLPLPAVEEKKGKGRVKGGGSDG